MNGAGRAGLACLLLLLVARPGWAAAGSGGDAPRRVGLILFSQAFRPAAEGFREGMARLGYREGRELLLDVRDIGRDLEQVPGLIREFTRKGYDLVVTTTTPVARAALAQPRGPPLLFTMVASPLRSGLVSSLRVPGGRASGVSHIAFETLPRRLILFKTAFPSLRRVALFHSSRLPFLKGHIEEYLRPVANELKIELVDYPVNDTREFDACSAAIAPGEIDGIFMLPDPISVTMLEQLVRFSRERRLPLMVADNALLARGGVMGYSPDFHDIGVQVAGMADRVLRGAEVGRLPVQNPWKISLLVSVKEAR
ncbi:MAG TPA: hypothetical protein ENK50_07190, partial [Sedimenticola sp.]|nr:hypothetical protein [Sedimenticola sp.]